MSQIKIFLVILLVTIFNSCRGKMDKDNIINNESVQQIDYVVNRHLSSEVYSCFEGDIYEDGFVPSPEIAFQIAEIVFNNIYGREHIEKEKPFFINLENDIWIIEGTSYTRKGGVAYMEMRKNNGEILKVCHGK
jgi:hypothetical protein